MINQRKKKRDEVRVTDTQYNSSDFDADMDAEARTTSIQGFDPRTFGGKLGSMANAQLNAAQATSDDRADAEESNLDILDRGSRYKRKNEKLKKFKV